MKSVQGKVAKLARTVANSGYGSLALDRLARQTCEVMESDGSSIVARDRSRPALAVTVAGCGADADRVGSRHRAGTGIASEAMSCGRPAVRNTPSGAARGRRFARRASAAVPLVWAGAVHGALVTEAHNPWRRFGAGDLEVLQELADLTGAALRHADRGLRLLARLDERICTFAEAIDERDGYTADHSRAVLELSWRLGERLSLELPDLFELELAALLHDIGKIAVPNAVLNQSRGLDAVEEELVQRHPVYGAELLSTVPGLEPIATIVRFHHERWDGRGYPDGLAGERIPLASRIVAVADAYDAMTSTRPYRGALSTEAALRELRAGGGLQFDPQLVEMFQEVLLEQRPGTSRNPAKEAA